ncbi:hypothetical protein [Sporisorium scitamineum]|uniref:Transcription factor domain-containing protein n=1 Tax=Sporisorium scitamineum TaxID=49012 RepID=A0A0F7S4S9_9BASI|nr:hypothetical protein [Sporisorium scitamineum]
MMAINNVQHIFPNFFYSTFVCDEAYRPQGRFKRIPHRAEEISMQALQYAIVAYASQYGSQSPGEWRGDESDRLRRQKDTQIAEAAWMRARDFLMTNSSVATFRMAYALHLFSNTCPPLRSHKADMDVVQDTIYLLQTGLRMMDDLATDLLRQQDEDLFALGYHNIDGARMDDDPMLSSDPGYRARVDRALALRDVSENLLWYSAICDAATTGGYGMPPIARSSTRDKVDIDALQLSVTLPAVSISAPRQAEHHIGGFPTSASSLVSMADASMPFGSSSFGSIPNVSRDPNTDPNMIPNVDPTAARFGDPAMLRLEPNFMMPTAMNGDLSSLTRDWSQRGDPSAMASHSMSMAVTENHAPLSTPASSDAMQSWNLVAHRALHVSKRIPYAMAAFSAAPGNPARVKELLSLCQTGAATQIMIWQRNGNFGASLDNPRATAAQLTEKFRRTWTMILFVQQVFQPLLDLDAHLYTQMPASAQSMITHLINQVGMGSLIFLELCSVLEGMPWMQGSKETSCLRASSMLRAELDQSRDLRNAVRRRSALRIGRSNHMVDQQVKRTLSNAGSPLRQSYSSKQTSPGGSGYNSHRGSEAGISESSDVPDLSRIDVALPQDDMVVPAMQIHSSRHPVPTHLAAVLHISFCALVPDALQEISEHGAASPITLDALDADLRGLQGILDSVLSFGPGFHREPSLETVFSTRNWLVPNPRRSSSMVLPAGVIRLKAVFGVADTCRLSVGMSISPKERSDRVSETATVGCSDESRCSVTTPSFDLHKFFNGMS